MRTVSSVLAMKQVNSLERGPDLDFRDHTEHFRTDVHDAEFFIIHVLVEVLGDGIFLCEGRQRREKHG